MTPSFPGFNWLAGPYHNPADMNPLWSGDHSRFAESHLDNTEIPSNRTPSRPPQLNATVVGAACGCGCSCDTCACSDGIGAITDSAHVAESGIRDAQTVSDSLPSNFSGLTLDESPNISDINLQDPIETDDMDTRYPDTTPQSMYAWSRSYAESINLIDEDPFRHFLESSSDQVTDDTSLIFALDQRECQGSPADSIHVNYTNSGQESTKSSVHALDMIPRNSLNFYVRGIGAHAGVCYGAPSRFLELTPSRA